MSEFSASTLRDKMKEKAKRMAGADPSGPVDASSWTPPEPMHADIQTGMRPISKQSFKKGGAVDGERPAMRADRKPRKSGGLVNEWVNRNDKEANEERPGIKHSGGYADGGPVSEVPTQRFGFQPAQSKIVKAAGLKDGGTVSRDGQRVRVGNRREHRDMGGILSAISPAAAVVSGHPEAISPLAMALGAGKKDKKAAPTLPVARKNGGAAKGKTNINIIIGQPAQDAAPPPAPPMPPMPPPMMAKPPMPPPGPMAGAGPAMPPPGMPPMGRKHGGYIHEEHGAGSGLGRLDKLGRYGDQAKEGES